MKKFIKESVIIILLIILIFLLIAILFYDYMPISIAVPENVATYSTAPSVKEEIDEVITEHAKQTVSFEITESDLKNYKKSNSYDATKPNPFLPNYGTDYYKLDSDSGQKNVADDVDAQSGKSKSSSEDGSTSSGSESKNSSNTHDTKLK